MKAQFVLLVMAFSFQFSAQASTITLPPGAEVNIGDTTVQCSEGGPTLVSGNLGPKCYWGFDPDDCKQAFVISEGKILKAFNSRWNSCAENREDAIDFYLTATGSRACAPGGEIKFETSTFFGGKAEAIIDGKRVRLY